MRRGAAYRILSGVSPPKIAQLRRQAANVSVMRSMPERRGSQTQAAPQARLAQIMPVMSVSAAKMRPTSQRAMAEAPVKKMRRFWQFDDDCAAFSEFLRTLLMCMAMIAQTHAMNETQQSAAAEIWKGMSAPLCRAAGKIAATSEKAASMAGKSRRKAWRMGVSFKKYCIIGGVVCKRTNYMTFAAGRGKGRERGRMV